jgi:hypothetical protein
LTEPTAVRLFFDLTSSDCSSVEKDIVPVFVLVWSSDFVSHSVFFARERFPTFFAPALMPYGAWKRANQEK